MTEPIQVIVHAACPEGGEFGTPPVMVEENADCPDCGKVHDIEACPDCGADIIISYGLGCGPGIGLVKMCEDMCGWTWKKVEPEEDM